MAPENLCQIGSVINSHGVKGEMKIYPLTDDADLLLSLEEVWLDDRGELVQCQVLKCRPVQDHFLLQLDRVRDMDHAKALQRCGLYVEEELLRPLDEDEIFIHDLMGAEVFDEAGRSLGKVDNVFETGANAVCEVKGGPQAFLFPVTKEVLLEVDPSQNRLVIRPLEGLLDLNQNQGGEEA